MKPCFDGLTSAPGVSKVAETSNVIPFHSIQLYGWIVNDRLRFVVSLRLTKGKSLEWEGRPFLFVMTEPELRVNTFPSRNGGVLSAFAHD